MFFDKTNLKFIEDLKQRGLDIVCVSVTETIGHCYAKLGNMMFVNSKEQFIGVLGSPSLHEKIIDLTKQALESNKSISYENTPKDKNSAHGISSYELQPFYFEKNYDSLSKLLTKPYSLLIFGSGAHVSSLINMANLMGWKTAVIDLKIRKEYVRQADELIKLEKLEDILSYDLSSCNASVILSHSPKTDDTYLEALLKSNVEYIGILGNKKNMQKKREQFNLQDDKRFFAPVGFDIGGGYHSPINCPINMFPKRSQENGKI